MVLSIISLPPSLAFFRPQRIGETKHDLSLGGDLGEPPTDPRARRQLRAALGWRIRLGALRLPTPGADLGAGAVGGAEMTERPGSCDWRGADFAWAPNSHIYIYVFG